MGWGIALNWARPGSFFCGYGGVHWVGHVDVFSGVDVLWGIQLDAKWLPFVAEEVVLDIQISPCLPKAEFNDKHLNTFLSWPDLIVVILNLVGTRKK